MSSDPITAVSDFLTTVVNKVFPDKSEEEKQRIVQEMEREAQNTDLLKGQQEINKIEASSSNLWNSGWRPFFGWCCGAAFAYSYVLQPFLVFIATLFGFDSHKLPAIDILQIMPVLGGMLGIGYYRTQERIAGVIPRGK